jgi:hypothetical protein
MFAYFRRNKNQPRNKLNSISGPRNFLDAELFLFAFGGRGWGWGCVVGGVAGGILRSVNGIS